MFALTALGPNASGVKDIETKKSKQRGCRKRASGERILATEYAVKLARSDENRAREQDHPEHALQLRDLPEDAGLLGPEVRDGDKRVSHA
jgi:hypothetical protein